jgi:anti-anti-sigma regulatory factor
MVDVAALRRLWRVRRSDFVLAAVTAGGVLVVGVLPGIGVGVAVSLLEVLRRAILPPTAVLGRLAGRTIWRDADNFDDALTVPGLLVYRFDAPLFFANAAVLREQVLRLVDESTPPVREVVLNAEGIVDMDITGAETLDALLDDLDGRGTRLVLARTRTALRETLRRLDLEERIGLENFHLRVRDAAACFARRAPEPPHAATDIDEQPPTTPADRIGGDPQVDRLDGWPVPKGRTRPSPTNRVGHPTEGGGTPAGSIAADGMLHLRRRRRRSGRAAAAGSRVNAVVLRQALPCR